MKPITEVFNDYSIILLKSNLTFRSSPLIKQVVQEQISDPDRKTIILDFSQATSIDSSGIGTLIMFHRNAGERNKTLVLCCLSEVVKEVLDLTRVSDVFQVFPDPETAVKKLGLS